MMRCKTRHFCAGSIIADSREDATGLMVITSGSVSVELPMESQEKDEGHEDSKVLLHVLGRG